MPPAPSGARISYGPRRVPEARVTGERLLLSSPLLRAEIGAPVGDEPNLGGGAVFERSGEQEPLAVAGRVEGAARRRLAPEDRPRRAEPQTSALRVEVDHEEAAVGRLVVEDRALSEPDSRRRSGGRHLPLLT